MFASDKPQGFSMGAGALGESMQLTRLYQASILVIRQLQSWCWCWLVEEHWQLVSSSPAPPSCWCANLLANAAQLVNHQASRVEARSSRVFGAN